MSDLLWLTEEQIERLRPFFPESHGRPRVDARRVLRGIVFVNHNGLRWRDALSAYARCVRHAREVKTPFVCKLMVPPLRKTSP